MTDIERLGTLVWDLLTVAEDRIDPDSAEGIELRKAAVATVAVKGDDPLTVSGRELAYSVLEHLQGFSKFDALKAASEAYEKARIKAAWGDP